MIQPAALPAVPGLPPLGYALPAQAAEGLEAADFGALLAIETHGLASPGTAAKLPVATLPALLALLPEAAVLPEDGKPLPVATSEETSASAPAAAVIRRPNPLPIADDAATLIEARPTTPAETAPKPDPGDGDAAVQPEPRIAELLAQSFETTPAPAAQVATPLAGSPPEPQAGQLGLPALAPEAAPNPAMPRSAPVTQGNSQPAPAALLAQAEPRESPAQPSPTAAQSAPPPITLTVITVPVELAPRTAETRLRLTLPTANAAAPIDVSAPIMAEPQARLTLLATGPVQAPESAEPLTAEPRLALPVTVAAARPRAPGKAVAVAPADRVPPVTEPMAPATALANSAIQPLPTPSAFTPTGTVLHPHDFTQLIDRLVAARELVQPQGFQVSVQHSEFGPVQLRLRQEGDGLSVTMASADPDFARAVSAAPAPVLPALTAETAGQGGPRSDSQAQTAANTGGSAQPRGGSPERREDRSGPADNPAPARHGEERGSRRSGIFA